MPGNVRLHSKSEAGCIRIPADGADVNAVLIDVSNEFFRDPGQGFAFEKTAGQKDHSREGAKEDAKA